MAKTLTIVLPDALEQALTKTAAQTHQSAEDLAVQLLTQQLLPSQEPEPDPLIALFGSVCSNTPDLADRHDDYLGDTLYTEMHRDE